MQFKTLSVRQPWAWLIVHGYKGIENREWLTNHRGPLLIHASLGMTPNAYLACRDFITDSRFPQIQLPTYGQLLRGGIVGIVEMMGCVRESTDPWFEGPIGWVLNDARPLPFFACRGHLNLFDVDLPKELLHGAP